MPRGRRARRAPRIEEDPLHKYSRWDIRIAQGFYYTILLCSVLTVIGIWLYIFWKLLSLGLIEDIFTLHPAYVGGIIAGAVTGHLLLLVLFYALFKGGILRLCQLLFKDRAVAKKFEDFALLRILIGVLVLGGMTTIFFILLGVIREIPQLIIEAFIYLFWHLSLWKWFFDLGLVGFVFIGVIILIFVFWNHGVFFIVGRIKEIEEEVEVEERLRKERLKEADEKTLQKIYKKETGKKAIYKGQETKGYIEWKKENNL
ncbi:MAG: hypothetical protein EU548_03865 [Promethearchaeota archaeon]|nr:MAG: hypothetical protein EU548_03865 [Candidatus Lokiarchaeota archaeon]